MTLFSKIFESSRAWKILITLVISSFEIIKVAVPEAYIFFWIPASITEAAAVIPNGAKTFFAKGRATLINGPTNLLHNDLKKPEDWIILEIWFIESLISVDRLLSRIIHEVIIHFHEIFLKSFLKSFLYYF